MERRSNHKTGTMGRKTDSSYDLIEPNGSSSGVTKLRYDSSSVNKSPGSGIKKRTWSPGQATLYRRRKIEGETSVADSFGDLHISGADADDEDSDYLTKSLRRIEQSEGAGKTKTRTKRSGRRSKTPNGIRSSTEYPIKSKSMDLPPPTIRCKPSFHNDDNSNEAAPPRRSSRSRPTRSSSLGKYGGASRSKASGTHTSRSGPPRKSKSVDRHEPTTAQRDLPIEMQRRLYRVTDPNLSIKERVELELEFMKGTREEKRCYLEFRHHFDRNKFFDNKALEEKEKQHTIDANAREERRKEAAFQREVDEKHRKERQKEEESKERERQAIKDARLHSLSTIANQMSEIKNAALEAATVSVARNQYEIKSYEDERRRKVEDFRKNEGKDMPEIQRALKEALIEQEDPEEKRMVRQHSWKRKTSY